MRLAIATWLGIGLAGIAAAAPTVTIYRCVAADGQVTIQNDSKCPKGTREQKRVVETPAPTPARPVVAPAPAPVVPVMPVAPAPVVDASDATSAATPLESPALPAPPIYVCLTADAQRYYSEAAQSSHCAPLATVGLDGQSTTAAEACEVVEDRCEAVAEAERCAAWSERRRRAVQALTFSPEQVDQARAELAHVDEVTAKTVCVR